MLDIIASMFPRTAAALRRERGLGRREAAQLLMAARFGNRAEIWTAEDCDRARRIIAAAFSNRPRLARLQREG